MFFARGGCWHCITKISDNGVCLLLMIEGIPQSFPSVDETLARDYAHGGGREFG